MKREIDLNKENKMVAHNNFWRADYDGRMSINAKKLLRLAITQCRLNDKEFYEYEVKISDLAELCGIDSSNLYREAKKICAQALRTILVVGNMDKPKDWKMILMFSECEYTESTGVIRFEISERVKPLFLELKGDFTRIALGDIMTMRSGYSMRVYEMLCWKLKNKQPYSTNSQKVILTLDEIRRGTDTIRKFKQTSQLREKVLDIALREINASDIGWHIEVKPIKDGRTITAFEFEIWSKNGWNYMKSND